MSNKRPEIPFGAVTPFQEFYLYGHKYVKYGEKKAKSCETGDMVLCDTDSIVEVDETQGRGK